MMSTERTVVGVLGSETQDTLALHLSRGMQASDELTIAGNAGKSHVEANGKLLAPRLIHDQGGFRMDLSILHKLAQRQDGDQTKGDERDEGAHVCSDSNIVHRLFVCGCVGTDSKFCLHVWQH